MSTDPTPTVTATVILNIETFNDISTGSFCTLSSVDVNPTDVPNGASVGANPLPPYTVRVAVPWQTPPLSTALTFQVNGPQPASGSAAYSVEAVYFSGSGQSSVFSKDPNSPPGTVTVFDTPTSSRPTGRWNFAVIVMRTVTDSTGTITWKSVGIIDPPIDNEPGR